MSRQKSHATIEREREKSIRRERLALRRAEREAKRAARAEKARLRELVKNGESMRRPVSGKEISIFDIIHRGNYLHHCRVCHKIKKTIDMKTRDLCEACYYNIELGGETAEILNNEQGEQGVPSGGVDKAPLQGAGDLGTVSPTQDEPDSRATLNIGR